MEFSLVNTFKFRDFSGGPVVRIRLPMQGTQVQSLVRGQFLMPQSSEARAPQLLKPRHLGPVLCDERSHCNGKSTNGNEEEALLAATRERLCTAAKT